MTFRIMSDVELTRLQVLRDLENQIITVPVSIRFNGVNLPYRTFGKIRQVQQADIIENKRLGPLLEMIREAQLEREPQKRSTKGPKRRDQKNTKLFKVG